jgi:hypothetical protein
MGWAQTPSLAPSLASTWPTALQRAPSMWGTPCLASSGALAVGPSPAPPPAPAPAPPPQSLRLPERSPSLRCSCSSSRALAPSLLAPGLAWAALLQLLLPVAACWAGGRAGLGLGQAQAQRAPRAGAARTCAGAGRALCSPCPSLPLWGSWSLSPACRTPWRGGEGQGPLRTPWGGPLRGGLEQRGWQRRQQRRQLLLCQLPLALAQRQRSARCCWGLL